MPSEVLYKLSYLILIMPPVALREALVVILDFFCIAIVSSNKVMSKNSSIYWRKLRGQYFIIRNRWYISYNIGNT